MRAIIIFLIFSIFIPFSKLSAQDLASYQKGLALKFDDGDIKKLNKFTDEVREGLIAANEAKVFYNNLSQEERNAWKSSGHKKALKLISEASEVVREAHNDMFEIYQEYADNFWETQKEEGHYAAGMNKARYYERMANRELQNANKRRDLVTTSDNFERALVKFKEALDLEKLAIRDKGRSLNIYQDFPVEYDYGWDDDVDALTVARFFADKYVEEPDENRRDTLLLTRVDTVVIEKEVIVKEEDIKWLPDVQFRIQIAAHIKPISSTEIQHLYNGPVRVNVVFEDNWYKYQMGPYTKYSEAKKVMNESNVEKAFIVPYRGDQKLTIKEALKEGYE